MEAQDPALFIANATNSVEEIDRKLAKCNALTLNLKSRRNRLVPISTLPKEVLSKIFFFASRLDIGGIKWIQLSHVCRDWRDLALETPTLWKNPPLQSRRWTEVMLIRSKMAGLTVQVDADTDVDLENFSDITRNHSRRIKCIQLEFTYNFASLLERLPESAPNLESLMITYNHYAQMIPDGSLCDMGRLQHMELSGLHINWDLHLPQTLTTLKLHQIPFSFLDKPQMGTVMNALERMPLLQILELENALPPIDKPLYFSRTVVLPKLQTLRLFARVAEAETLLRCLSFPSTTDIQITSQQDRISEYLDTTVLMSLLALAQIDRVQPKILKLSLENDPQDSPTFKSSTWHIQTFPSFKKPCDTNHTGLPSLDLSFTWWRIGDTVKSGTLLRDLCQNFLLGNVRNLSLTGQLHLLAVRTILDTVGALPRVRTLTITLEPNIVQALNSHLYCVPGHTKPPYQISFPSLQNLVFKGEFVEEFAHEPENVTVGMLLACLEWRSDRGAAVKWLNVEECKGIDQFEVDRLWEFVEEIVWDSDSESGDEDQETEEGVWDDEEEDNEEEEEEEEEEEADDEPELGIDGLFDPYNPDIMDFEDFY